MAGSNSIGRTTKAKTVLRLPSSVPGILSSRISIRPQPPSSRGEACGKRLCVQFEDLWRHLEESALLEWISSADNFVARGVEAVNLVG